jgi:pimeloyl-ACP methyl ester carboxylesterase
VITGAGSSGLTWAPVAGRLAARVLPIPDRPNVAGMAADIREGVAALPLPRVLVGTSAGAMVALEIARSIEVQSLVLVAAGFGLTVSESALQWLADNPPGLHEKLARLCLADPSNADRVRTIVADYDALGQPLHLRQLRAVAKYVPTAPAEPPPTLVLWGVHDRAVPLADHLELALRYRAAVVPIPDAAHVPFLEQPELTLKWLRFAAVLAGGSPPRDG